MTYGSRVSGAVAQLRVDLREELVSLRADYAVDLRRQVDVLAPLLPGGDVLVPEVDPSGRRRGRGDGHIVARFRRTAKSRLGQCSGMTPER